MPGWRAPTSQRPCDDDPALRAVTRPPADAHSGSRWKRWGWWVLCVAVALVHLGLADGLADDLMGDGAGSERARIGKMEVSYVTELAPSLQVPQAVSPMAPAPRPRRVKTVKAVVKAASAPEMQTLEPVDVAASSPVADELATQQASADDAASAPAVEAAAPAASAAEPVMAAASAESPASAATPAPVVAATSSGGFEWPPSTRLSYALTGNYRGEIHGEANVEWVRQDSRYQVHLDVLVGPSFAPLLSRRMSSDGELSDAGLSPRRYEETTKAVFRDPRVNAITFEADRILLPKDVVRPTMPGVQDTASQFVQLIWLFRTQPGKLQAGAVIEMPLALPRRVDRWVYDVVGLDPLDTPFGRIDAWHLKPRRPDKPMGEMTIEIWFAPKLEYLPVRFLIRQDAESFADLLVHKLPQQAAR